MMAQNVIMQMMENQLNQNQLNQNQINQNQNNFNQNFKGNFLDKTREISSLQDAVNIIKALVKENNNL